MSTTFVLSFKSNGGVSDELRLANAVARLLVDLYQADPADVFIADHTYEELSKGSASVAWEGSGMDCWPLDFLDQRPEAKRLARSLGVTFEALNTCILGIYPIED